MQIGDEVSGRRVQGDRDSPGIFLRTEAADRRADRWQVVFHFAVGRGGLVEVRDQTEADAEHERTER